MNTVRYTGYNPNTGETNFASKVNDLPPYPTARLFAAAPDLLEALRGLVEYRASVSAIGFQLEKLDDWLNLARIAIDKAEAA